ncbi:HNH endonuclease signature motif containing protein [Salinisphaera sp. Q1T1-3]|uniref:HNH endonuclease signature motif containing protein n=1 Tax=Salinisphaera sp. Q1T1-3 TaxID=2321229 RepID=UPI000E75F77D|nr:HNH endonuclease signature motif containing protein [Salinisphaera sp. Q1T1-3]RJS95419.1 HNH endonuclease [Salinisphaera sp. Q1T1-3]
MSEPEKPTSRNIPLPVQREVRQRCGFGCVICGMPLYEYEHMEGWAKVRRHVADEITLLCDQHHREKTSGLLPLEAVRVANASPFNLQEGASKPYTLHFSGEEALVTVGGNRFSCADQGYGTVMVPLSVDGIPLIGLVVADGHLLLNVVVFNEFNEPVLHIKNNQLYYSTSPWDIQLVGTKLTIREWRSKILIELQFSPPNEIHVLRGRLLCNGVEVLIRPTHVLVTNNSSLISGCSAINCHGGLIIGHHSRPMSGFFGMESVPRYLGDRSAALEFEREHARNG